MGEWIRVDEHRPEVGQWVLYYFDRLGMHLGWYAVDEDGSDIFYGASGFLSDDVTHWMPMPDAPKV